MSTTPAPRSLWLRWKSLRLPWRRKWLCGIYSPSVSIFFNTKHNVIDIYTTGQDLHGVTFWEHTHNPISSRIPRRTAMYPQAVHPGDVQLTPAWMQWLRNARVAAPSIEEQRMEVARQQSMVQLAAAADRRWEEKASYLKAPPEKREGLGENVTPGRIEGQTGIGGEREEEIVKKENPWKKSTSSSSDAWQPKAWTPGNVERR